MERGHGLLEFEWCFDSLVLLASDRVNTTRLRF
jgi:hypothetical protein